MQSSDQGARRSRGARGDDDGLRDTLDAPGAAREVRESRIRALESAASDDYSDLKPVDPDHYVIGGEIAAGGMGRVVKARDRRLGREVAIKELLPDRRDAALRFEAEARITARLQHPAIVNIYEAGVWPNGDPFYAMTKVAGRSMEHVVAERVTLTDRLGLLPNVTAVVDALAYAHSQHVIHRDLKPQNVLIGEFGETVVIDWGLAKDLSIDAAPEESLPRLSASRSIVTGAGGVVGTPAYMPPEQARGEPVDERADVYALGALLRFVVTGTTPVTGDSAKRVLDRVLAGEIAPIDTPQVPADLLAIIEKAMAFDPGDRYPTALELAADLKRFQTGQLVNAYEYSRRERLTRWLRRHRAVLGVTALAVGILVALGVVGLRRIIEERAVAERGRASLLQLQGRQELLAGRPGAALAYLSEVYSDGFDSAALRLLSAEAARPYETPFTELTGHTDSVVSTAFDPGGTRVLTASRDGTAALWDARTGQRLRVLRHGAPLGCAALDRAGTRVVTAADDGTVLLWNASDGSKLRALSAGEAPVYAARFSPDGAYLAAASADGNAYLWNLATDDEIVLRGHDDAVNDIAFAPHSDRVATASADATARVWSLSGEPLAIMAGHAQAVNSVMFSESGTRIVTASRDASVRVWNAQTGALTGSSQAHSDEVRSATFSRGDSHVVSASADGTAIVWDVRRGWLRILRGHRDAVSSAKFSPSGKYVVTAGLDRAVRIWDWDGEKTIVLLEGHAGIVNDATFAASDDRIASAGGDGTARIWDATDSTVLLSIEAHQRGVMTAAYDGSGKRIVTAGSDPTARIWDATSGELLREIEEKHGVVLTARFDPGGARVVTGTDMGEVALWDADTGTLVRRLAGHDAIVYSAAWSPDGARVITAGEDHVARVWNAETGEPVLTLAGHGDSVYSAVYSPDGRTIATTGADGRAILWNAATGERTGDIGQIGLVLSAAFSPDSKRLAIAGGGSARIWRLTVGGAELIATLERPGMVYSAVFSPNGAFLLTAGSDATARVWDAATGELLAAREGHLNSVISARFSPTADALVTGSDDGTVRIWSFHTEERSPEQLARFVNERVPWALHSGKLVPRTEQVSSDGAR